MEKQKNIAMLVCYMGSLPWYFEYFLASCKYNPSVDFFVITDDKKWSGAVPPNVEISFKTLRDISILSSSKLGFNVEINYGYKLCDFKPAYGLIFNELLTNYNFWGHCDLDIILGDIRGFITDDILENFDLISVRPDWIPGCFLLYKNTDKMNYLFCESKDFKLVFTSDRHFCFDETNFTHQAFKSGKKYWQINSEVESMMHVVKRLELSGYIRPFFDFFMIEGLPGRIKWKNGKLYYRNKYEIMLFHLMYLKDIYKPDRKLKLVPQEFQISPSRIYARNEVKTNEI